MLNRHLPIGNIRIIISKYTFLTVNLDHHLQQKKYGVVLHIGNSSHFSTSNPDEKFGRGCGRRSAANRLWHLGERALGGTRVDSEVENWNILFVCMYVCLHVCMYACMHVCMYACMHVCMHACMYVCMYVLYSIYIRCTYIIFIYIYGKIDGKKRESQSNHGNFNTWHLFGAADTSMKSF